MDQKNRKHDELDSPGGSGGGGASVDPNPAKRVQLSKAKKRPSFL